MNSVFLPLPLWERAGERGLVDDVFISVLHATVPLTLTLSRKGRGDLLDKWRT